MQSDVAPARRVRHWRSISEKRQIVQLTMEPGASVPEIARVHGVNANQLFKWRRAWERGELTDSHVGLLPLSDRRHDSPAHGSSRLCRNRTRSSSAAAESKAAGPESRLADPHVSGWGRLVQLHGSACKPPL
jgi:transposase-like protein